MAGKLDRKVKMALDETRLLVLGIHVLLGFQFQAFFQTGFPQLASASKAICAGGLTLQILALGLLIIPSMEHRLVEAGTSSKRLIRATSYYATAGLIPFSLSLGLAGYVVIEAHFGWFTGIATGLALWLASTFAWFGLEMFHRENAPMPDTRGITSLSTKVEQVLTEARVIIPGAQALLGFQFVAMLTSGFNEMPQGTKIVHTIALGGRREYHSPDDAGCAAPAVLRRRGFGRLPPDRVGHRDLGAAVSRCRHFGGELCRARQGDG
jgi:hypothetical protein